MRKEQIAESKEQRLEGKGGIREEAAGRNENDA